jgi:hypothetical protein
MGGKGEKKKKMSGGLHVAEAAERGDPRSDTDE